LDFDKKIILKKTPSENLPSKTGLIDESKLKINYRHLLNPAQFEAVSSLNGSYLIIAGAGSGKTRTLVFRVARLIELGFPPESILLLTFTRKAANEMMNRASLILDDRCSKIRGGTFHSFANLTLRKYAKAAGLSHSFTILDQSDSEDVVNLIRSSYPGLKKDKRFPNKQTLFKVFSLSVNTNRTFEDILLDEYPHFYQEIDKIIEIQKAYSAYKKKNSLLDYDDLLICLLDFLNSGSPAANSLLKTVNFLMVDEYQDTNKLQADIVLALSRYRKNVMVVGDDSQSIYAFRGANFKNIMDYPNLFENTKIIYLEENYRSTQEILDFANRIIDSAIEKYPKVLYTNKTGGERPTIIAAHNENMQSKFIVQKILQLREEGIPLSEIAVLFRASFFSFNLEIELGKANIPFVKFGGMKFVESAHIKDIIAFLRIALNENDFVSWLRVLLLLPKIGPKSAQKVMDLISAGQISIKNHPDKLPSLIAEKFYDLFSVLHIISMKEKSVSEKTQLVIDYYYPFFRDKYDDFNSRKKDLDILLTITSNYRSLDSFISDMAIEPPVQSVVDVEAESKESEYVTLSTIHSAKGLEWNTVFIIHALDGFFPMSKAMDKSENIEEERRLMYVAVTRSKENLFITLPMNIYDRESGTTFSKPSRFLTDIPPKLMQGCMLEEEYDNDYYF